jgi:hypothetical protein
LKLNGPAVRQNKKVAGSYPVRHSSSRIDVVR